MKKLIFTSIIKFGKGTLVLFGLNLLLILSVFTIQACNTDFDLQKNHVKDNSMIKMSLNESINLLNQISIINHNSNSLKKGNEKFRGKNEFETTETYYLYSSNDISLPDYSTDIQNLNHFFYLRHNYDLQYFNQLKEQNLVAAYELPVQPILDALQPAVNASKQFFYDRGFNEQDIIEMLDGEHEAALIPTVMEVTENESNYGLQGSLTFFGTSAYARGDFRDCFEEATGIAAGVALIGALTSATIDKSLVKKLVKEAVKKIGGRALGGIGLAMVVADIAYCMYD